MKIFIAGVMQGNKKELGIYDQQYRKIIAKALKKIDRTIEIIDPDITDPNRLNYTKEQSAEMFFRYSFMAGEVDLLIAYVSEASMGSAVEMWEAWRNKVPVFTISQMSHNWVVKLLSQRIYNSLEEFLEDTKTSSFISFIKSLQKSTKNID